MDPASRQIVERIRAAAADRTRLRIRGGGTKDFYGHPPRGEPLDTRALAGITSYEPTELVVTVRGGTPLAELEALLAAHGQCLPFEPPCFDASDEQEGRGTVGGMVAAGLSGPSRASVGAVRDYVLGAALVNGRGELLRFGGTVMKNVAGYDVSRVLAGSLGSLGVIAEVSLKVLPVAPAEATLCFDCGARDALDLLNTWGGQPLPLNASRWTGNATQGRLWLRLRGAAAAVEAACAHLGGERQDPTEAATEWRHARDMRLPWFDPMRDVGTPHELWRLAVPQTAPPLPLDGEPLVEWHGGQRWYITPPGAAKSMRAAAQRVGGHATCFRKSTLEADANSDTPTDTDRFDTMGAANARIHRALMDEFDPHAVFDRGRLLPSALIA